MSLTSPRKHIAIKTWLAAVSLTQYESLFSHYNGVEDIIHWRDADLKGLGVKENAHRARLVSSLDVLRAKLGGSMPSKARAQLDSTSNPTRGSGDRPVPRFTPRSLDNQQQHYSFPQQHEQQYEPLHAPHGLPGTSGSDCQLHNQSQINKQLWYHGNLPRQKAEALLKNDGDFLVRDSSSQKGDFVLTCQWNGSPLHFMVNRQHVLDPSTGGMKTQYQFEEKLCDSVPQLVHLYLTGRKAISEASKARILHPVNRRVSADSLSRGNGLLTGDGVAEGGGHHTASRYATGPRTAPYKRAGSQPLLDISDVSGEEFPNTRNSPRADDFQHGQSSHRTDSQNLSQPPLSQNLGQHSQNLVQHVRSGSEPVPMPIALPTAGTKLKRNPYSNSHSKLNTQGTEEEGRKSRDGTRAAPPPKPSRIPTVKLNKSEARPKVRIRNKQLYEDDGKDYSDYDQVKSWTSDRRDVPGVAADVRASGASTASYDSGYHADNRFFGEHPHAVHADNTYDEVAEPITPRPAFLVTPDLHPPTKFDMTSYVSQILTPANKPLESSAVATVKPLLMETEPKILALHLTLLDLDVLKVFALSDLGVGVYSGLELITLPQGRQMRLDALERFHCLRLFVATSILLCTSYDQRARMLNQWLQVAMEMRGTMGNLYGFAYVMEGLQCPQVDRLRNTWISAKQLCEKNVQTFRTKLVNVYKSLRTASRALPLQNVTIPYIVPLLELLQRQAGEEESSALWEEKNSSLELDVMLAHLDIARIITDQHALYTSTSFKIVGAFRPIRDMLELFDTRMHLRLLWGHRGCVVKAAERYEKFEQVLRLMSLKCEPIAGSLDKESSL